MEAEKDASGHRGHNRESEKAISEVDHLIPVMLPDATGMRNKPSSWALSACLTHKIVRKVKKLF